MAKPTNLTTGVKRKWYERLRGKAANGNTVHLKKATGSEDKQSRIVNNTLWCRHEIKYVINEPLAVAIAEFIKPYVQPDRYCRSQPKVSYPIATLYLDSDNLQLCQETMRGQKNRFKLRIRSYTDELDYPRFFEIKRRAGSIIIKSRTQVLHQHISSLLSGLSLSQNDDDGEACLRQFILYMNSIGAGPVVRTRYVRQAFEGTVDRRVRITFDRNLSYKITRCVDVGLNGTGWQRMCLNQVVLEIKFTGCYPAWIDRMVKYFGLRQQSISKYASSIKQASLFGLYKMKASGNLLWDKSGKF
jgi:SPX domain protein involved in polyphosphate accumulation